MDIEGMTALEKPLDHPLQHQDHEANQPQKHRQRKHKRKRSNAYMDESPIEAKIDSEHN